MAVTRDGVPVRCWTFPGNTADTAIIRTVKDDLAGWNLSRMVWVADRGFASAANRAYLTRGGGHYIHPRSSATPTQRPPRRWPDRVVTGPWRGTCA
jgi:transposase